MYFLYKEVYLLQASFWQGMYETALKSVWFKYCLNNLIFESEINRFNSEFGGESADLSDSTRKVPGWSATSVITIPAVDQTVYHRSYKYDLLK